MKKTLFIFSIFFSVFSFAQGTRIMYDYRFVPNLNKKDSADTELMYLDIKKDGSKFYSRQKFVSDSTRQAYFDKQISMGSRNFSYNGGKEGKVAYMVDKTYPDFVTTLHTATGMSKYAIKTESPMPWKILPDKKKIDQFDVQKATLDFGGRSWTAWFSQDFPFQDGPYKFQGLPGLILEMEDATGTHQFRFVGSKKFDEVEKVGKNDLGSNKGGLTVKSVGLGGKELEVTEEQFKKQWKEYKNDPVKEMKQMLSQGNVKFSINMNGKAITDNSEMLRSMEKSQKEQIKNDNNKIEPTLYP